MFLASGWIVPYNVSVEHSVEKLFSAVCSTGLNTHLILAAAYYCSTLLVSPAEDIP